MRALVQHEDGDEETFVLIDNIPKPKPSPGQALIRVCSAALNPVDILRGKGFFGPEKFPRICGYDFAGIVEVVNDEGDLVKKGDRVYGDLMRDSAKSKEGVLGSVAEYCVCDVDLLGIMEGEILGVGGKVGMHEVSGMGVVGLTAIQCFEKVQLKQGDKFLVLGGSGGVGLHAMMIAKGFYKATSVGCTASEASFELCKKMGADLCVDKRLESAKKILEGWADVVLDCVGEFEKAKMACKEGGRVISIVKESFGREDVDCLAVAPAPNDVKLLTKMLKDETIRPVIDSVYKFDDASKAIHHMASGRAKGKIVIHIAEEEECT